MCAAISTFVFPSNSIIKICLKFTLGAFELQLDWDILRIIYGINIVGECTTSKLYKHTDNFAQSHNMRSSSELTL